jgi:hypothetical protein
MKINIIIVTEICEVLELLKVQTKHRFYLLITSAKDNEDMRF